MFLHSSPTSPHVNPFPHYPSSVPSLHRTLRRGRPPEQLRQRNNSLNIRGSRRGRLVRPRSPECRLTRPRSPLGLVLVEDEVRAVLDVVARRPVAKVRGVVGAAERADRIAERAVFLQLDRVGCGEGEGDALERRGDVGPPVTGVAEVDYGNDCRY
jgi:hypothetical protein